MIINHILKKTIHLFPKKMIVYKIQINLHKKILRMIYKKKHFCIKLLKKIIWIRKTKGKK